MAAHRWSYLMILALVLIVQVQGYSACTDNRNPAACFEGLRALLRNTSAFWFGSDYQALCPQGPSSEDPLCTNSGDPAVADSIASRMLGSQSYDLSTIDTILNVVLRCPEGKLLTCGTTFYRVARDGVKVDPLNSLVRSDWYMQMTPAVTWAAQSGKKYTVLVYDVAELAVLGLYINIDNGVMAEDKAVVPYRGPSNPLLRVNVYVFALFAQGRTLDRNAVSQFYSSNTQAGKHFSPAQFIAQFSLQGPLGINMMMSNSNPFSVGKFQASGKNYCPYLIKEVLDMRRYSFAQPFSPRVSVNVSFQSQAIRYQVCCQDYDYPAQRVYLAPLSQLAIDSVLVRNTPTVAMEGIKDAQYLVGKFFTLMLVDTKTMRGESTNTTVTVHWQVVNIPGGSVGSGEELLSYVGTRQWKIRGQDKLVYLLLEQTKGRMASSVPPTYAGSCPQPEEGRCEYRVESFLQENGLKLVGANWQTVANDAYVRHLELASGTAESVVCRGVSGYASPCPVSRAPSPALSLSLLLGLAVLALLASL